MFLCGSTGKNLSLGEREQEVILTDGNVMKALRHEWIYPMVYYINSIGSNTSKKKKSPRFWRKIR